MQFGLQFSCCLALHVANDQSENETLFWHTVFNNVYQCRHTHEHTHTHTHTRSQSHWKVRNVANKVQQCLEGRLENNVQHSND